MGTASRRKAKDEKSEPQKPAVGGETANLLTRRELAVALGSNVRTIAKWQDEGMPVARRGIGGRPSKFDVEACRAWKKTRDESTQQPGQLNFFQERANKERWQAAIAEQTFLTRQRELLPRAEIEKAWSAEVTAIRSKLLSWPTTIADHVYRAGTIDGVTGVERALATAVRDVLRELAVPPKPVKEKTTKKRKKDAAA